MSENWHKKELETAELGDQRMRDLAWLGKHSPPENQAPDDLCGTTRSSRGERTFLAKVYWRKS